MNHGNVPFESVNSGVTIEYAEQTTTLSLIALRRLQFPKEGEVAEPARNEAARTVLAALGLCAATLAFEAGVDLRSRCLLWPETPMGWEILARPGEEPPTFRLTPETAVVSEALFDRWRYEPKRVSFRWDPQDEKRQYALQAVDPTNAHENPPLAAAAINFLALAALPLFPLVPDRLGSQVGFDEGGDGKRFQWPVWTVPLTVDTVRSLLSIPWDERSTWPSRRRSEVGVAAVFQATIVQPGGRYRCFTPARAF